MHDPKPFFVGLGARARVPPAGVQVSRDPENAQNVTDSPDNVLQARLVKGDLQGADFSFDGAQFLDHLSLLGLDRLEQSQCLSGPSFPVGTDGGGVRARLGRRRGGIRPESRATRAA